MCQSISPIDRKTTVPQRESALEEKHSNWMSSKQFKHTHTQQAGTDVNIEFWQRNCTEWETARELFETVI